MDRWHITVSEPKDVGRPYVRRFTFDSPGEALTCYVKALRAGFLVQVNQVKQMRKERVGSER